DCATREESRGERTRGGVGSPDMTAMSRSDGPDRVHRLLSAGRPVLLVTSLLLSLVLAEMAVRVHRGSNPVSFHVVNSAYGQYEAQFGQRFLPHSKKVLSLVSNS